MIMVCVNRRNEIVSIQNQEGKVQGQALIGCIHIASHIAENLFKQVDEVVHVSILEGNFIGRKMI